MLLSYEERNITDNGAEFIWDDFRDEFMIVFNKLQSICPGFIIQGVNMNWEYKVTHVRYDADLTPDKLLRKICSYDPNKIEIEYDINKGQARIIFLHHNSSSIVWISRPSRRKLKILRSDCNISRRIGGGDINNFDSINELLRYYGHSV